MSITKDRYRISVLAALAIAASYFAAMLSGNGMCLPASELIGAPFAAWVAPASEIPKLSSDPNSNLAGIPIFVAILLLGLIPILWLYALIGFKKRKDLWVLLGLLATVAVIWLSVAGIEFFSVMFCTGSLIH